MKSVKIISALVALLIFFNTSNAQERKMSCCNTEIKKCDAAVNDASPDSPEKMDMQQEQHKHSEMNAEKQKSEKNESIVRQGTIDLKAIDKNKNGKVFQCPMDWNVISDKADNCPLCKMKLKEVSIEKAKENLKENGFKTK